MNTLYKQYSFPGNYVEARIVTFPAGKKIFYRYYSIDTHFQVNANAFRTFWWSLDNVTFYFAQKKTLAGMSDTATFTNAPAGVPLYVCCIKNGYNITGNCLVTLNP
jgi:hypothetical protein